MPIGMHEETEDPAIEDPVKPASAAELRREGRLARIVKALVSGSTVTEIAEAEGIDRLFVIRMCGDNLHVFGKGLA